MNDLEKKLLIVEDSTFFSNIVGKMVEERFGVKVDQASTYAEATAFIEDPDNEYFLSLLDLNLPDAPDGEITDYVTSKDIPAIVFTSSFSEDLRERILSKKVIDYVLKDHPSSLDYLIATINRVRKNANTTVLVVDDSSVSRAYVGDLLRLFQFKVLEAGDGIEALDVIEKNPEIQLVITDYFMPNMDGFELTQELRKTHSKDDLAVIGISSAGSGYMTAKFLKNGANDFLTKPFLREEFFCRVTQNVEFLDKIQELKNWATRDFLTGLHNRRFLFDAGKALFASAKRGHLNLALAIIDIDHFKKVNDTFGHEAGDQIIKQIATALQVRFRETDIVTRIGGEEFCVLLVNYDADQITEMFEQLRQATEAAIPTVGGRPIPVTISIGVNPTAIGSLEEAMAVADELLYQAKESGRNKVVFPSAT